MNDEIVPYDPAFRAQVVDLRRRVFGEGPASTSAYLEWKYERNPYLGRPHLYLALVEGRVVGLRGWHGSQWWLGGGAASRMIPCGADFAVDHEHRGRGFASRLLSYSLRDLAAKGHEYVISLSANRTTRLLQIRSSWRPVARYQTLRRGRFSQSAAPARRKVGRQPNVFTRAQRRATSLLRDWRAQAPFYRFDGWAARVGGTVVAATLPRIPEMGALASRCYDRSRIQHVRDESYYRWRFMNPFSAYRFVFSEQSGGLDGFLVLQQPKSGGTVTIVDWATSTPPAWSTLLAAVIDAGIDRLQIASTAFSEGQLEALEHLAFEPIVEPNTRTHPAAGVFLCALSDTVTDERLGGHQRMLDSDCWDVRPINSDAY